MSRVICSDDLRRALSSISTTLPPGPILLHTDLARLGILDRVKSRDAMCADYVSLFQSVFPNTPLLFPTFNYDFCSTGVYHRQQSPSQVGALTDYLRRHYPHCRSLTPVFHFCVLQNDVLSLEPVENCFGMESLFADLVRRNGSVGFLGAPFSSNTFLHHVEEVCDVTYRFHKRFSGVVVNGDQQQEVTLLYRVRSLDPMHQVVYDWPRLQSDLEARGILHRVAIPRGHCLFFRARDLMTYWSHMIRQHERFLVRSEVRA